jgi:hypothetical protein
MNILNKISTLLLKACVERIIFYLEYFNRVDLKYVPGMVAKKNLQTIWNPSLHCGWGCLARGITRQAMFCV